MRTSIRAGLFSLLLLAPSLAAQQATGGRQFTLFIYESPAQLALRTDTTARGAQYWSRYAAFGELLQKAGVLRGGSALHPRESLRTVISPTSIKAASYATSPNPMGGYFIIEVASLDEAVRWATRARETGAGAVEVRAAYPVPGMK